MSTERRISEYSRQKLYDLIWSTLIKQALAHKGGNTSEAAKLLGVDRGKIYRRLATADGKAAKLEG